MVIDTSALLAILQDEPERRNFNEALEAAESRGRHPAGLNYGDCFSYALAKVLNAPLLYKGGDFAATDVDAVVLDPPR